MSDTSSAIRLIRRSVGATVCKFPGFGVCRALLPAIADAEAPRPGRLIPLQKTGLERLCVTKASTQETSL